LSPPTQQPGQPGQLGQPQWAPPGQPGAHPYGGYAQPHVGYPPPQHGHPQVTPHGYGHAPYGAQPHPAYRQARPKSSSAGAVLGALAGALVFFITFLVWLGASHNGYGVAAACGVVGAGAVFLVVLGAMNKAEWKTRGLAGGVGAGVVFVLFTGAGPSVSSAFERSNEERKFEELAAGPADLDQWHASYLLVDEKFRRDGWEGAWMTARVQQASDARDIAKLRGILGEIDEASGTDYAEAHMAAATYIKGVYAEAIEKLSAPAKAGADAGAVDQNLRNAFVKVLGAFEASPDANLYLAFQQSVDLSPPDGDAEVLAEIRASGDLQAKFPQGAPIIDKGEAFDPKYDNRRRNMFVSAMTEAFSEIFDDELLHLVPLDKDDARDGKHVLQVQSKIRRIPTYGTYFQADPAGQRVTKGLTFEFVVNWSFKLVDDEGEVIYQAQEIVTAAAPEVSLGNQDQVPQWAIYGALMDSCYYNYSRDVIAGFGLTPPPERTVFPYNAVSSS
jgi:hypothetical protein